MKQLFVLMMLALSASCSQTPWQKYDESLFVSVFEPSEASYEEHIESLTAFASEETSPPGMCAELAYFESLAGRPEEAGFWLQKELEIWPESALMVEALSQAIQGAGINPISDKEEN